MPHKVSWKISEENIIQNIQENLLRIFKCENYKTNVKDLCFYLNISPIKIHSNKKYNSLLSFIKINYGGILPFLKKYKFISIHNSDIIFDHKYFDIYGWNDRITSESEWILIDNKEY